MGISQNSKLLASKKALHSLLENQVQLQNFLLSNFTMVEWSKSTFYKRITFKQLPIDLALEISGR